MSENLPKPFQQDDSIRVPSLLGEINLQQIRYTAAQDLLVVGSTVIHRGDNGLFCLNDLHDALVSDDDREAKAPNRFFRLPGVKESVQRLETIYGPGIVETVLHGENRGTYAHEELAQDYAGWINPIYKDQLRAVARKVSILQTQGLQDRVNRAENLLGKEVADKLETLDQLRELEEENEELRQGVENLHLNYSAQIKSLEMSRTSRADQRYNTLAEKIKALQVRVATQDNLLNTVEVNTSIARERFAKLLRNSSVTSDASAVLACQEGLKALERVLDAF